MTNCLKPSNTKVDKVFMKELQLSKVLKREIGRRTQAEVADESGVPRSLLNDWVTSRRNPGGKNLFQLLQLAKYFGITLEELLFDTKPQDKTVLAQTRFTDGGSEYKICIEKIRAKK